MEAGHPYPMYQSICNRFTEGLLRYLVEFVFSQRLLFLILIVRLKHLDTTA